MTNSVYLIISTVGIVHRCKKHGSIGGEFIVI